MPLTLVFGMLVDVLFVLENDPLSLFKTPTRRTCGLRRGP